MTPRAMVDTAILLGAFVTAAGAYGLLYCGCRLYDKASLRVARNLSCVALCAIAAATWLFTPLHLWWKLLVVFSCAIYLAIPPATWRHLNKLHRGEASDGPEPAQHNYRAVPRMFRRAG